jgi:hypothetical protein
MKGSHGDVACQGGRYLNAVALQNAVLCAECDVGSRSLFNIARMFGGNLPKDRASLIAPEPLEMTTCETVLTFPGPHRLRKRVTS